MKLRDHMKLILMICVLVLVRGVLYWRPQIASAQSAASDMQNGGIEDTVDIVDSGDNRSVVFNAKKKVAPYFEDARKDHVTEHRTA